MCTGLVERHGGDDNTRRALDCKLCRAHYLNGLLLREVAANQGVTAYTVDNARGLQPAWVAGKAHIGVTAGASAPKVLVQEVVTRLKELGASEVSELSGITDRVTFPLPTNLSAEVS